VSVNGTQPLQLGFSLRDDNTMLAVDLTNPDICANGQIVIEQHTLHIVRSVFLWHNTAYQRLAIRNPGERAVDLDLAIDFDNDFADIFEVRGLRRQRRGVARANVTGPDSVTLNY